jgi:hypothetical protein
MTSSTVPRARGRLEELVREVCDGIADGSIVEPEGRPWTPHRLAKLVVDRFPGSGAPPSTGAISDTLRRWKEVGFANIDEGPVSFVSFTEGARTEGLTALKAAHRKSNKIAKHVSEAGEDAFELTEEPVVDMPVITEGHGPNQAHAEDW